MVRTHDEGRTATALLGRRSGVAEGGEVAGEGHVVPPDGVVLPDESVRGGTLAQDEPAFGGVEITPPLLGEEGVRVLIRGRRNGQESEVRGR